MITKSMTAKLAAGAVGFAMTVSAFMPSMAGAQTATDLQAQINSLLSTIAALQAQLAASTGGTGSQQVGGLACATFTRNLTMASTGAEVMSLQKFLNSIDGTQIATAGAGSPGNESSYFGGLTRAAVSKFQQKYGITPTAGYWGAISRAKAASLCAGGGVVITPTPTPGTTPQGGSVSVYAGSQPTNSLAPESAARIPFTTVVLSAGSSDITVNSITVERSGLAQDAVFSGVVLLNSDGTQIGIAKTLNSNHQAMVGEPWVIKAGTSQTVTIAGNMAATLDTYAGQVAGLNVVAVNTSASVSGSLPITGAMHTINASLTLGTAAMTSSSFDPDASQTKEIGTTGYKFSGVKLTAGSAEQVRLWSVRWNQSGSASSGDLGNVMVYVDGTAYPTTVSADGKYYSASFSGGLLVDKGLSKDIYIQGDVVGSGSAGRTVKFDIYKATDIYVTGVTYGYGITATQSESGTASDSTSEFTAGTPFFDGSKVTVSAGSVTSIQKATSIAAQNIAVNVPNQVLGGFTTDIKGEPISVQSLVFTVATTTGTATAAAAGGLLTNVTLVDENGAVVAGPVDATDATVTDGNQTITFTDTVTFPIGAKTYTLKGKVPTGTGNGMTYVVSTTPSSNWTTVTGQTTGNTITLTNGVFSMNTMTVKAGALAVTVSTNPATQNIVSGGVITFANYQFDASQSGEDARFSSLTLTNGGSNTSASNCQLFDGSTALNTGSNSVTADAATEAFTLDSMFTVPKGTVKTLTLKCTVPSTISSGTYIWGITSAQIAAITATGVSSGASITPSGSTATGQTLTVTSGSFAVTIDPSTSNYTTVAAGTSGVTIGTFKFRATNENVNLTKIGLTLSTSTPSDLNNGMASLWANGVQIGTATFGGSNTIATSTLTSPLLLTKDTDVLITIKADLGAIGTGQTGTEGRLVKIDVTNAEGTGASSGGTLQVGSVTAGVNGVRMFKSFPTIAQDTLSGTGVADGRLMRFKITASSAGPVGIANLNFTIATSGTASTNTQVSSVLLNVYSDASYSTPVSGTYGGATGQFGGTNGTTGGTSLTSNPTLDFRATTNPLQIPAGTTYYFELKGSVGGVSTGSSVTTTLNGDAAYLADGSLGPYFVATTTSGLLGDTNNDFAWSGNATSTAVFDSNDWANGFGIVGLPSGGFSNTRSQ